MRYFEFSFGKLPDLYNIYMPSTGKQVCPTCGQSVNERPIVLYKGMVMALFRIFQWCEQKNRHEFTKKEVKHLFDDVVSSTFAYWRWFGGLAYNPDGIAGHYGLNMERCRNFFGNYLQIPTLLWKNPLEKDETKAIRKEEYRYMRDIKSLKSFLDENNR